MPPLLISPPTLDAVPARKPEAPAALERTTLLADNRRARFDYEIQRRLEAGIALLGTEIKSLRAGHANLRDGYARVEKGEVWLRNVHIAPWANSPHTNHDPLRPRNTLVPLRMYTKNGRAKVELGVARGRKRYDKRTVIREREAAREMQAAIRRVGRDATR